MDDRDQRISDVRALLDFLEAHPDVPLPTMSRFDAWLPSSELAATARSLGYCEKEIVASLFVLRRRFGGVRYEANFSRSDVCTATVTGTEVVPERVIPAHTKNVVEWECPDSILDRPDTR